MGCFLTLEIGFVLCGFAFLLVLGTECGGVDEDWFVGGLFIPRFFLGLLRSV